MGTRSFTCIAFDLDDTLLDTSRLLVPQAARESAAAMVAAGVATDVDGVLAARERLIKENPRAPLYDRIVAEFGMREGRPSTQAAIAGHSAFRRREVERDIMLSPTATELLARLRLNYKLYLVTSGDQATQMRKIEILQLAPYFQKIYLVDSDLGMRKGEAFAQIASLCGVAPHQCLSVGNRVDTDIAEARALGWRACWISCGEYARMLPSSFDETPDFKIERLEDLESACQL